jgi:probable biosynthetic protein (TIGR04099 family)
MDTSNQQTMQLNGFGLEFQSAAQTHLRDADFWARPDGKRRLLSVQDCKIGAPAELSLDSSLCLGMPQLAFGGLSEFWLLMECGHRHWTLLERMLGMEARDICDEHGCRLYASFVAVHMSGASLAHFHEADQIALNSRIAPLSARRFLSSHFISGHKRVRVDMISAFVRKALPSDADTEVLQGTRPRLSLKRTAAAIDEIDSVLPSLDREIRRGRSEDYYLGLSQQPSGTSPALVCRPCPAIDFNGVGLLYFARYIDFVDRAEWEYLSASSSIQAATLERRIFYFANLNPGDSIKIELLGRSTSLNRIEHLARISRMSDGRHMAFVYTRKEAPSARPAGETAQEGQSYDSECAHA